MTLLENGDRNRHAVNSVLCGIDGCMKQVNIGHVTPTKFNMAAKTVAYQQNIVVLVEKY